MSITYNPGSTCNFAGLIGDQVFRIQEGILKSISIDMPRPGPLYSWGDNLPRHLSFMRYKCPEIHIDIIMGENALLFAKQIEGYNDLTIRDKFVSQCSIEELLVAVQAKLAGQ